MAPLPELHLVPFCRCRSPQFLRNVFAKALRDTWAEAKKQAAWDAESARHLAREDKERQVAIARFAHWSPTERTSRIQILKEELRCLPYSEAPIAQRQAALQSEIAQLGA